MWTMTEPKSTQDPVRGRRPLPTDGLGPLVAEAADDARRDGLELSLRPAGADDEVVGHRRQAAEVEQDDVGGLLVLGQFDDAPGELEWRALGGGRGRGAVGQAVGARCARDLGGGGGFGHDVGVLMCSVYSAWSPM